MIDLRKQLGLFITILCSLMLAIAACGDDDDGDGNGGNGGTTDTGTPDADGDPGVSDTSAQCDIDRSGITYPSELSDGEEGTRPIRVIIEAVDFANDILVIKNVSADSIAFNESWRIFVQGATAAPLDGLNLDPGARVKIHLTESGSNDTDDYYIGYPIAWIEACGGEVAVINNPDPGTSWFNDPSMVEAFVMWGNRNPYTPSETYNNEAVTAQAWDVEYNGSSSNVYVCWTDGTQITCFGEGPCDTNDNGIVATGSVTSPTGWARVSEADSGCLEY